MIGGKLAKFLSSHFNDSEAYYYEYILLLIHDQQDIPT